MERTFGGAGREEMFAQDTVDILEVAQPSQSPVRRDNFKDPALSQVLISIFEMSEFG